MKHGFTSEETVCRKTFHLYFQSVSTINMYIDRLKRKIALPWGGLCVLLDFDVEKRKAMALRNSTPKSQLLKTKVQPRRANKNAVT